MSVLIAVVFGLSIAFADYTIRVLVFVLDVRLHGSVVVGLTEPFTTTLAPALTVVALALVAAIPVLWNVWYLLLQT